MKHWWIAILAPAIVLAGAVAGVRAWLDVEPIRDFATRVPPPEDLAAVSSDWDGNSPPALETFDGEPGAATGHWPAFRGENYDGIATDIELPRTLSDEQVKLLWSVDCGEGYASPAVLDGKVYLLDYDQENRRDALRVFSLETGEEIWRLSYTAKVYRQHGMSRTVPAVTDKYVVTFGPKCHVMCADSQTGEFLWGMNLVSEYQAKVPQWYAGQCPLIDDDKVILAPGGTALMIAVDLATGEVLWETPNFDPRWQQSHVSILPITFADRKMYVYSGLAGVCGVAADGENAGEVLWKTREWRPTIAAASTGVDLGEGRIFITSGYEAGAAILQLAEKNDQIVLESYEEFPPQVFGSEQHTPVFFEGHIYGVMAGIRGQGKIKGQFVCLDRDGKKRWTSGPDKAHRYGLGPYLVADGAVLVMDDHGKLALLAASPEEYKRYWQVDLTKLDRFPGHDTWAPIAVAGDRLLLRDLTKMICVKLGE